MNDTYVKFIELHELINFIFRWWNELDFETKLPFARDRKVELFFWIVGVYFEPQYSIGRSIMTKVSILLTVLDDIYDAYATFEELVIFTEAIDRFKLITKKLILLSIPLFQDVRTPTMFICL